MSSLEVDSTFRGESSIDYWMVNVSAPPTYETGGKTPGRIFSAHFLPLLINLEEKFKT